MSHSHKNQSSTSSPATDAPQMCMAPELQPGGNAFAIQQMNAQAATSSSSGSSSSTTPTSTPTTAAASPGPSTADILANYQVRDDTMTGYEPWGPASWFTDPKQMTETEAGLLSQLQTNQGLLGLSNFKDTVDGAYGVSEDIYAGQGGEDGHQDAFRHMYWNAMMTREFGVDFAAAFGTAHEGVPGNQADREAMDLYNNEIGRNIAEANPDATDAEIQALIQQAVTDGQAVVIDGSNDLAFSNTVALGATGRADDAPATGVTTAPPEWSTSF